MEFTSLAVAFASIGRFLRLSDFFGPPEEEKSFLIFTALFVATADAHVNLHTWRLGRLLNEFLQITFGDFPGVDRKGLRQPLALGMTGGDEMLTCHKQHPAHEEHLEIRPDKYRALHSPIFPPESLVYPDLNVDR